MYFKGKWSSTGEKEPLVGILAASRWGPTERSKNGITERTRQGSGCASGGFHRRASGKSAYQLLPIYKVEPNPDQPRQDFDEEELQALADSITVHGIIQPLTVREMPNGYYQIIAGERRWRAARMANLSDVPAVIIEADDKKAMELALIENLQRQDLNPLEEALGYQTLMNEYGLTQEEAAGRVGKSRPAVANALRLLGLCPEVQERVRKGELSAGHARAILQLKSEKKQQEAAQKIVALGLSVRQAELLCKNMSKEPAPPEKRSFCGGLCGRMRKVSEQAPWPGCQDRQWQAQGTL